jgi:NAD(P)-dependent dehydrogenase (short-subunit alcohol dehydrogenase family)
MTKTVLITGASGGIGKATALAFATTGWNVAATSREFAPNDFQAQNNITTYLIDVTDSKSIIKTFTEVIERHGSINVVVNNAGYGLEGVFETLDDEAIKKQFEVNVFGLMAVTRQAILHMRPKRQGTVIQIASMGGRLSFPLYSVYHASKWAVEGFTESLQYELEPFGIRLKIIEPGVIKTRFYQKPVPPPQGLGYDSFFQKITSRVNGGEDGVAPELVAATVLKAATDQSRRFRYGVGSPAPMLLFLRKILPDRLFFYGIRKGFRI